MELNEKEQDVFWSCQNRLAFVTSMLDKSDEKIELSFEQKMGLVVILSDVLFELDSIDNGKYCQPQKSEAASEDHILSDSVSSLHNDQSESRGVQ